MFEQWTADASLTRIEEEVRRFWRRHDVPGAGRAARRDGPAFVLYQQPLAAAGQPPADQACLQAVADLYARYRAMRGEAIYRRVAWAGHGLPVEVAVEAALGSTGAGYDLDRFNAACRQAAADGQRQGEALAERLGAWLGPEDTYDPLAPESVSAVWSALRRLWDAGRLRQQRRVVPVCPRCATPLSETEAARRAVEVKARSVWLRLPWDGQPDAYLLAWTPAPWTLVGMVALAAHPETDYLLVELPGREDQPAARLLLAEAAAKRLLAGDARPVRRLAGKALREARYHSPFTFLPAGEATGRVVLSADVPLDQGSGLLPVTPGFDALSLALAQAHDLPLPDLLDDRGALGDTVTPWRGLLPLDATPLIVSNLQSRGLLWRQQIEPRLQAQCPYCETLLLPQAREVWLLETAGGPWVVGRDRAWGAPLPVWTCERCGEQVCVAGLDDLARRLGLEAGQIDPHRPAVDRLVLPCPACGGTMRRVAEVVDAAFEAAVLPWATATRPGPADLAIGLGDEHLGWLGDLTEVSALLRGALAWERALALPEAEAGVDDSPQPLAAADARRWAVYTGVTPAQAEREFLQPVWRLVGELAGSRSEATLPLCRSEEARAFLDRWLTARLNQTTSAVAEALDADNPGRAAGALAALVDDLDRWFVPCRPGHGLEVLEAFGRLLAPFAPHLAEALYHLVHGREAQSVHLAAWPEFKAVAADEALLARMKPVWRLAALGGQARAQAAVAPDRHLPRAWVQLVAREPAEVIGLAPFHDLLAEVLGVDQVQIVEQAPVLWQLALDRGQAVSRRLAAEEIEAALANLDAATAADLVSRLWSGLSVSLAVGAQAITLLPGDVRVSVVARPGWAAAAEPGYLVLLEIG